MMTTLFATSISGPQVPLFRAMGLAMLALGARVTGGSDDDAALSGATDAGETRRRPCDARSRATAAAAA